MENNSDQDNPDNQNEEIVLMSSNVTAKALDEESLQNISFKFVQIDRINLQSKNYCIYDNQYLGITEFDGKKKRQYWINLAYINIKPSKHLIVNWAWTRISIILLLCGVILWFTPLLSLIPYLCDSRLLAALLFILPAFLASIKAFRSTRTIVNFCSPNGRVPFVELLNNNPNKIKFRQFLAELIKRSQVAIAGNNQDSSQQLASELSEHRRLRDAGILSADQYTSAKNNIMFLHKT